MCLHWKCLIKYFELVHTILPSKINVLFCKRINVTFRFEHHELIMSYYHSAQAYCDSSILWYLTNIALYQTICQTKTVYYVRHRFSLLHMFSTKSAKNRTSVENLFLAYPIAFPYCLFAVVHRTNKI